MPAAEASIDVERTVVEIRLRDGGGGLTGDHADWANAQFTRCLSLWLRHNFYNFPTETARRKQTISSGPFVIAILALAVGAACNAAEAVKPPIGFNVLLGSDQLPLLVDWPAYQDSSYSRRNVNQDAGNFLGVEPNGDQALRKARPPSESEWQQRATTGLSRDARLRLKVDFSDGFRPTRGVV